MFVDELVERIATELQEDPQVESLLADALALTDDDPDAAAALVLARLHRERRGDERARAAVRRAAVLTYCAAADASRHAALDVGAQATVAAWTSATTRRRGQLARRWSREALTALRATSARLDPRS